MKAAPAKTGRKEDTAMGGQSRAERRWSRREEGKRQPHWEALEEYARAKIQGWVQELLEEEITEFLGREKSERRAAVDAGEGYRNGYGKPRRISMMAGTVTVRRPRVRGWEERFESRILPLFVRRTEAVGELLPQLYLHGLAQGDFALALRGLLGGRAPRYRPPRSSGCGRSGSWNMRTGVSGGSTTSTSSTPGRTGST